MNENEKIVPGFDDKYDESLDITLERLPDIQKGLLLHLSGYIDTYNTGLFQKRVSLAIDVGYTRLIFDCLKLNYFSSTGIGSFTSFLKAVKPLGGEVVLFSLQPKPLEIFQLLGFSQFFPIKNTHAEAIEHFQNLTTTPAAVFPATIQCPNCSRQLRAPKAGRFRCPRCSHILMVDEHGAVTKTRPQTPATFPKTIRCPIQTCKKQLRVPKAGRFRCPQCSNILIVDNQGHIANG